MRNRKRYKVTSNWDTAIPEQKERFYKRLNEALSIMYKSVVERYLRGN